jgi:regulatory protein
MKKITKLKKKGVAYQAMMDDGAVEKISQLAVFDFSLSAGKEFDDDRWNEIKRESDFHFAWDSAMRMLSVRAHSEGDLKKKLGARKFAVATVERVIAECARLDLLDDAKFAEEYIRELRAGGAGSALVKLKLRSKGIKEDLLETVMNAETPEIELESAKTALAKKAKTLAREADPRKRREKTYRYLASRGFSYETISKILGEEDAF